MNEIAIRSVDDLVQMAKTMGVSALLPNSLRGKPADVFVTIMYGHELGLTPMASVQGIYVVNGRPMLSAQTWLALLRRAGHMAQVKGHDDEHCTVWLKRGDTGEEHTSTYTYAEAVTAKLATKDVWTQHRKNMLLARAVANGCRFLAPEIALGALTEGEEITDDQPALDEATGPLMDENVQDAEVVEPQPTEEKAADLAEIVQEFQQADEIDPTLDADWGKK